ncbi:MAG TPA: DUF881 domain-containing protein [Nocardioidaceae bacterium]|nr:DUF881 domain-containing protein [Nocardioidaceae bacterium]
MGESPRTHPRVHRRAHRGPQPRRASLRHRLTAAYDRRFETYRQRSLAWRLLVLVAFVLAGALFVTSAVNSDGTDLRAGRYGDLGSLVREHKEEADSLQARVNLLADEVDTLAAQVDNDAVEDLRDEIDVLQQPAGLKPVRGPGLSVTLDDAPEEVVDSAEVGPDNLVVHQQDIQAVVNAMWAGGAEAMTIQGQRVISTTGIKCVGNTVVLHDIPYSPPYVITAVGNSDEMLTSIGTNRYISIYREYVEEYQLGWEVDEDPDVGLPGYDGPLDLGFARPAGDTNGDPGDSET